MGIIISSITIICISLNSCTSDDVLTIELNDKIEPTHQSNLITLSNGETILLQDTTTYSLNLDDLIRNNISFEVETCNLFDEPDSRTSSSLRAYGYDNQESKSDWKKWLLSGSWEDYGLSPTTYYIGRYVKVYKNLPTESGTAVVPASYTSENAPQNVMGWIDGSSTIGFSASSISDEISQGVTIIFYLKCDISGIEYNRSIPAEPNNFIWAYKLVDNGDIW